MTRPWRRAWWQGQGSWPGIAAGVSLGYLGVGVAYLVLTRWLLGAVYLVCSLAWVAIAVSARHNRARAQAKEAVKAFVPGAIPHGGMWRDPTPADAFEAWRRDHPEGE